MHPHLPSCFDFQPKQTANPTGNHGPLFPWRQHTRAQLWPWWFGSAGTDKEADSEWAQRCGCRQSVLLDTGPEYTRSVRDLSHPISQVILTHPVTWRRLAEQRRRLSAYGGTRNRGVMERDTTSGSVINSVYCWQSHAVSGQEKYSRVVTVSKGKNFHGPIFGFNS